jgi:lactate permease
MTWEQNYNPLGFWPLSTAVAALPVVTLFVVLVVLRARVWVAAAAGMGVSVVLALVAFRMPPLMMAGACLNGFIFGMTRIAWIIIASIFLYQVAVETGQFQVMKDSIAALSSDRRLQVVLIAFCFGAFLEGVGGGGAPVAIAGSFLIGLGFPPFQAATLCLIANTAPVAWGGVGNPIRTLAGVTGMPEFPFGAMAGRILPIFSAILPCWLVTTMVGWRKAREVWPALAVSGLSFAAMQFYWSNFRETGLVDIIAALFSLLVMVIFLKLWKPAGSIRPEIRIPKSKILRGWSSFLLASIFIFLAGLPAVVKPLSFDVLRPAIPGLHLKVLKMPPVAPVPTPETAIADLNVIAVPGTAVVLAAALAAMIEGFSLGRVIRLFFRTLKEMTPSILAITFMIMLAYVTRYSGMDTVLGLTMTRTARWYPFFGTLLGWLGVALTGTDAGSNALFGNLQKVTAEQLGLSPVLMGAANSAGGVMGKMIDAQSIVVASSATQQVGNEANIFKAVFPHSIVLACLVGGVVVLYAFVFPGLVPK